MAEPRVNFTLRLPEKLYKELVATHSKSTESMNKIIITLIEAGKKGLENQGIIYERKGDEKNEENKRA